MMIDGRPLDSLVCMGKLLQYSAVEEAAALGSGLSSKSALRGVGGVVTSGAVILWICACRSNSLGAVTPPTVWVSLPGPM